MKDKEIIPELINTCQLLVEAFEQLTVHQQKLEAEQEELQKQLKEHEEAFVSLRNKLEENGIN